jgi:hypothetical protein
MMRTMRVWSLPSEVVTVLVAASLGLGASVASAHPLGNSTVNRQAGIVVLGERVELHYLLDVAEIPALIAQGEADANADGETAEEEWRAWTAQRAASVGEHLHLTARGKALALVLDRAQWRLEPGEAGLSILKLAFDYSAEAGGRGATRLEYRDEYEPERAGWKEVFAAGREKVQMIHADVPSIDRSAGLTRFEGEPPQVLSANIEYNLGQAAAAPPKPSVRRDRAAPGAPLDAVSAPRTEAATAAATDLSRHPVPADPWSRAGEFFRLGAHHILQGLDHLVFLLGLLLLNPRLMQSVRVITAFTIAHSLTLGLAASGLVAAPGVWVEAGIAGTIVYVGVAGWRHSAATHGAWLAFAFGLVHGLGFAGGLADLLGGSSGHWLAPLAAFNLGIEAMQLALIAIALPLLDAVKRYPWGGTARRAACATIAAVGLAWLVTRSAAALSW